MKYYLSSFKIGNQVDKLKKLVPNNKKFAYISNALDFSTDLERRTESEKSDINDLENLDFIVEPVDLRKYFNEPEKLKNKIKEFGTIWVRGGNVFVLRQAMKLSGFDNLLKDLGKTDDILYGGYSAGICVLAPNLKGLELVDDATQKPYKDQSEVIWEGLNILNYAIAPHYKSNHPESEDINKVVNYYIKNKILFKALLDGEVIVIE